MTSPQMVVVNCKGNLRPFQGNLGWWNIMIWPECILYFENLECERKWKTWLDPPPKFLHGFWNMMGLKGQKLTSKSDVPLEMFRLVNISAMIQLPDSCWEGHRLLWCPWFRALWQWGRGEPLGWEVGCRRWRQSQEKKRDRMTIPFYSLLCWFIKEDITDDICIQYIQIYIQIYTFN